MLGYSFIFLNDKREYDKLTELDSNLKYHANIVKSYGFDIYTGDFNAKKFPITKEDSQSKNIAKDFDNYDQALSEYNYYLKELIKKYNIKPRGNLVKRLAFNVNKNDTNLKLQNCKFITAVVDLDYFS